MSVVSKTKCHQYFIYYLYLACMRDQIGGIILKLDRNLASTSLVVVASSLCLQLSACSGVGGMSSATSGAGGNSTLTGQVTVSGKQLLRNGAMWVPHGYYQIAFEVPPGELSLQQPFWGVAQQNYTPQEYSAMATASADSVRMQIAQTGADPQNPLFSQAYLNEAIGAVKSARLAGLTVILSIQDEAQTGEQSPLYLPSAATNRVWAELVPQFGSDTGIVFELFNEPGTGPTQVPASSDWQNWATAYNATIASIRLEGAKNVVIADGLAHAETLTGAPMLTDSLNLVAYAAHPYAFQASDESSNFWDNSFGNFAASANAPVIITEWGQGYYCAATNPQTAVNFLQYLQSKGIGLEVGAWDWSSGSFGTARYNFPTSTAPNGGFTMFYTAGVFQTCGTADRGLGLTVNAWYTTGTVPSSPL